MRKATVLLTLVLSSFCWGHHQESGPGEDISLIVHYPLDGNLMDRQRNLLHGAAINGVSFVYDYFFKKRVANFVGGAKGASAGSAIRLPANALDLAKEKQAITVATWVYCTSTAPRLRIFDFGQNSASNFYMTTRHASNSFSVRHTPNGSGSERAAASGEALSTGSWQHCAVTVAGNNGTMILYLNGLPVGSTTIYGSLSQALGTSPGDSLNGYFIGRSQVGDRDFEGRMSDFRIYDRPLSGLEIQELYDSYFDDETVVSSVYERIVASLGTLTNRVSDMPFLGAMSKCAITWSSSNTNLIENNGKVRRPPNTNRNQAEPVSIAISVVKGKAAKNGGINVTLLRMPNDKDIVESDAATLEIESTRLIADIVLPTIGVMGSKIIWNSNSPKILSPAGAVSRPANGDGSKNVMLTATLKSGKYSQKKIFNVTVAQQSDALELIGTQEIHLISPVNHIPDLPYYVNGIYASGKTGPKVRVLWTTNSRVAIPPSNEMTNPPTNADDFAKPGTYTILGRVMGTNYVSKAHVTVVDENSVLIDKVERAADSEKLAAKINKCVGFAKERVGHNVQYNSRIFREISIQNKTGNVIPAIIVTSLYSGNVPLATRSEKIILDAKNIYTKGISLPKLPDQFAQHEAKFSAGLKIIAADTQKPLINEIQLAMDESIENLCLADSLLERPKLTLEKFNLSDVVLNSAEDGHETVFQRNQSHMIAEIAETNVDRFLWAFRDAFGVPQPEGAKALGGWDERNTKLRGHATGHYMSALAQCYLTTKSYDAELADNFLAKMNAMITRLRELQLTSKGSPTNIPIGPGKQDYDSDLSEAGIRHDSQNWGTGFISAYPPDQFIMLEKGAAYGTSPSSVWAPYYTLHKLLEGCLDIYGATGNKTALDVAADMGRWVIARLKEVPRTTLNSMWGRYIAGEYGGMNETMAHLAACTGDRVFLAGAKYFDNNQFFFGWHPYLNPGGDDFDRNRGLATNVDTMRTVHANQQLPQILGVLRLYDQTSETSYYDIANHFWKKLYHSYTYSYGGTAGYSANPECFTDQPDTLYGPTGGLPPNGNRDVGESCATYNINKITQLFFMHKPIALYMDFYERALYNHTLSSINTIDAGTSYHNPLVGGWAQSYGNAHLDGFSCCNGTGMEQHTKYQDTIFMHKGDGELYVNLYIPSTLKWGDTSVKLITNFPNGDSVKLQVIGSKTFDMKLRIPYWAKNGFTLKVNGTIIDIAAPPASYITVGRDWKDGDVAELILPMSFHLFETTNAPHIASIFYGPLLMAGAETGRFEDGNYRPIELNEADLGTSFERVEDANPFCRNLTFATNTTNGRTLKPMFDFGTERRMPYWNVTITRD
ncbi:MAG: glycoside hydrolase family 127 protein [Holophagales bacterium]|nr:glycoside hydrolase family 127 protein [Holophagales bacterium]